LFQATVVIETDSDKAQLKKQNSKVRQRATNKDLPPGCQDGKHFRRKFIPTLTKHVAGRKDPWVIAEDELLILLKKTWKKVFPESEYVIGKKRQRVQKCKPRTQALDLSNLISRSSNACMNGALASAQVRSASSMPSSSAPTTRRNFKQMIFVWNSANICSRTCASFIRWQTATTVP
jgi:hypothetical protein